MTKKRFIAGAICPLCKQIDSLRWGQQAQEEVTECVKCGHLERRSLSRSEKLNYQMKNQLIGIFKPQ